ncbi:MAG: phosphopyruvate hydratase [bacterium]|nr:phosphopyruvate hydratase [bacterium]
MKIKDIKASEILDSRGNPTVSATVILDNGVSGTALVPSGASTGSYEAVELRDGDKNRYNGLGVLTAVKNIVTKIKPALVGLDPASQAEIDSIMIKLDGTVNKANLGANAILAVSLAAARAAANGLNIPLYKYLTKLNPDFNGRYELPVPMLNVLNGGKHANWVTDIQEYLILPVGAKTFAGAIKISTEVYSSLKRVLQDRGYNITIGDEGGFAPAVKNNEEPLALLAEAVRAAGYTLGKDVVFGLDAAATEFYSGGAYNLKKENKVLSGSELMDFYGDLQTKYPLYSFEDVFAEDDFASFKEFTAANKNLVQVIGDDLYATNVKRLTRGIKEKSSNSILIKLNQVGTLTETISAVLLARRNKMTAIISHRSGETEDAFIADLVVALNTGQIKTGAPARGERTAKYNRLLEIEAELGEQAVYARFPFAGK